MTLSVVHDACRASASTSAANDERDPAIPRVHGIFRVQRNPVAVTDDAIDPSGWESGGLHEPARDIGAIDR